MTTSGGPFRLGRMWWYTRMGTGWGSATMCGRGGNDLVAPGVGLDSGIGATVKAGAAVEAGVSLGAGDDVGES